MTALLPNSMSISPVETLEGPDYRLTGELKLPDGMKTPTADKPRRVLALLLSQAGTTVTTATLAEELWSSETPRSYRATLQTYILKLRQCIGDTKRARKDLLIQTVATGYRFNIDPARVDALWFADAVKGIRLDGNEQQLHATSQALNAALALFRGPVLLDVQRGFVLDCWTQGVEEDYRSARYRRFEVNLVLGRHREILSELLEISLGDPSQEDFARLRMLALYRCGRRAEALETYRQLRQTMTSQLGIEPSPQAALLQVKILRGDTSLLQNLQQLA